MNETIFNNLKHSNNDIILNLVSIRLILYLLNIGVPKQKIKFVLGYANGIAKPRFFKDLLQMEKDYKKIINPVCAICGNTENLTIHHIKPVLNNYWLKYDINNFMVLCDECHYNLHHGGKK